MYLTALPRQARPSEKIKILMKARDLIKKGWVKGKAFANAKGEEVCDPKDAERFCATGAIIAVAPRRSDDVLEVLDVVAHNKGFSDIVDLNDHPKTRRRNVVRAFNKAIETVKTESKNSVSHKS